MSNQENDKLDEQAKEFTAEVLSQAIRTTRNEYDGIPIEEVAEIFFVHYDQAEIKVLIENLVARYEGKFGSRLYE